jgi:hypothetical protein
MTENELKSTFQKIDDNLNLAYETNDCDRLEELLSDSWTMLEPSIGIVEKDDFIKAIKEKRLTHSEMKKEVIQINSFDNITIVISRGRNIGQYLDKPFNTEVWVTNTYKKQNSNWICISTLEAPVPCV